MCRILTAKPMNWCVDIHAVRELARLLCNRNKTHTHIPEIRASIYSFDVNMLITYQNIAQGPKHHVARRKGVDCINTNEVKTRTLKGGKFKLSCCSGGTFKLNTHIRFVRDSAVASSLKRNVCAVYVSIFEFNWFNIVSICWAKGHRTK